MKLSAGTAGIIGGAIGGLIFLTFWLFVDAGLVPSLIAAGLGFGISLFFFRASPAEENALDAPAEVLIREIIASGSRQQSEMQKISSDLTGGPIRHYLETLASLTGKIVNDVREDPKDAKAAGRFLDYYADTALRIASIYRDVAQRGITGTELNDLAAKVERNLQSLCKAFQLQLTRLQADNLMDLDTELSVLQQTLQADGLADQATPAPPKSQS